MLILPCPFKTKSFFFSPQYNWYNHTGWLGIKNKLQLTVHNHTGWLGIKNKQITIDSSLVRLCLFTTPLFYRDMFSLQIGHHVKSNYNVTCISWITIHLPNILIFCWQELVTEHQYQAKFWSDIICVVTCNQICPMYCFFADKNLWPNMNIRQSSGQILSVLWLATWFIHVFLCYSSSKWNHLIQHTTVWYGDQIYSG